MCGVLKVKSLLYIWFLLTIKKSNVVPVQVMKVNGRVEVLLHWLFTSPADPGSGQLYPQYPLNKRLGEPRSLSGFETRLPRQSTPYPSQSKQYPSPSRQYPANSLSKCICISEFGSVAVSHSSPQRLWPQSWILNYTSFSDSCNTASTAVTS